MHPLDAISEPRRRELLALISAEGEIAVSDLAARVDVTRPAVSQHLRVLREAGIVIERRDGRRRLYRIDPRGIELARATIEAFLVDRLDDLETATRSKERPSKESLPHV